MGSISYYDVNWFFDKPRYQRVWQAYDLLRMQRVRLVISGCGGARQFAEDAARVGIGEFVLIDHDVVEEPNIGTQQVYLEDIGRPKVDALADRILQINPDAWVEVYQKPLDELSDGQLEWLAEAPLGFRWHAGDPVKPEPEITLLCGFTDNFYAQARVNRLALQFGLPSLCVQLYEKGFAGEITFTYPGVTPACHRCILSSRYTAYLERGYTNTVTSDGAPIFATTRVNSLKGMIALALLHHGTTHPIWGNILERIGNRTLVQIRMHPNAPLSIFDTVFAHGDPDRVFFDEAVWLPQEADPECPDCGGTGNLLAARGTFADTREMRRVVRKPADDEEIPEGHF